MSKSFIEQVHYIRIPVNDLELSAQWYRDVLGLQLLNNTEELAILKVNEGPFLQLIINKNLVLALQVQNYLNFINT
ncbi:VOC family protein [Gottfriedia acidiceleris]